MNKNWYKSKTVWAGLCSIITAIGAVVTGDLTLGAGFQLGMTGLLGIFLRDAIASK